MRRLSLSSTIFSVKCANSMTPAGFALLEEKSNRVRLPTRLTVNFRIGRATMFKKIPALVFLVLALPAYAQTPGFERVLSAVTLSFQESGSTDRAVLVDNQNAGADLYVYFAVDDAKPDTPLKPALVKKNAAWSGLMWGTRPSLQVSDKGSLLIKSANYGVGRSRWDQTLTVVYRNKEFVVAGLTYLSFDTLDPKIGGSCDLNFLTGKGLRNGKPVETKFPVTKLADWSDEKLPKECNF
jgi:hypothetical protein